jgi:hypothetical protein
MRVTMLFACTYSPPATRDTSLSFGSFTPKHIREAAVMKKERTRRETLSMLGAAGITILVGCGDDNGTGAGGAGGVGGEGGAGRGGGSSGGGSGASGSGTGGTAGGAAGGGGGGAGGTGTGGTAGAGGGGTGGTGAGGTAGARPDGGAGTADAGGTGGNGASGAGGSAGNGTGGAGTGGTAGTGTGGAGTGGTGPDGGAAIDAGRDGGNPNDGSADAGEGEGEGGAVQCQAKQETTVGPYPNIDPLQRRDIRGNTTGTTTPKEGVQLTLRMRVLDLDNGCAPISGAVVDIWQCDAVGVYAGYSSFGTTGQDFCRGYQITDAQGMVEFLTIFPGSYTGRAIHIHFSIQGSPSNLSPNANGSSLPAIAVAQLYFLRSVADDVFNAMPIYKMGAAITPNESDGIFGGGGKDLVVKMTKNGSAYVGEIDVGMRRSEIGK